MQKLIPILIGTILSSACAQKYLTVSSQDYSPETQNNTIEISSGSYSFYGEVTKVHDGDSVWVKPEGEDKYVIRLQGIDSPELAMEYGSEARDTLYDYVFGKNVLASCNKIDVYSRHVCVIYLGNTDANLRQVSLGSAWHYKDYQDEQSAQERIDYSNAEIKAKKSRRGLWGDSKPIPPWQYRSEN